MYMLNNVKHYLAAEAELRGQEAEHAAPEVIVHGLAAVVGLPADVGLLQRQAVLTQQGHAGP